MNSPRQQWFDRLPAACTHSNPLFPKPSFFTELNILACPVAYLVGGMQVTQEHVSAGCNRVVGALDWGNDHSVAYAAHNLVCLYDAEVRHSATA